MHGLVLSGPANLTGEGKGDNYVRSLFGRYTSDRINRGKIIFTGTAVNAFRSN